MPILQVSLYIATFLTVITLKNKELFIAGMLAIIYSVLCALHDRVSIITSIIVGIALPIAEYICIKRGIWKYNGVKYSIPLWLPIGWAIVTMFVIDMYRYLM